MDRDISNIPADRSEWKKSTNFTEDFLQIWLHLLKKSLMENFIFCAVLKLILIILNN